MQTDKDSRAKHRVGVLVPFTNTNLEGDLFALRPENIAFHFARLGGYDVDEIPDAEQMSGLGQSDINEPLRLISGVRPDIVLYGCTSATLSIGPEFDRSLAKQIEEISGAKTINAAGAVINALKTLKCKRLAFASPYVPALNDEAIAFIESFGMKVVSRADYDEPLGNYGQGELSPNRVFDLGKEADSEEAEVILLSCTDMRAVEIIDLLEEATGKPVISSNQAMLFQTLQMLGVEHFRSGYGRLFTHLARAVEKV